MLGIHILNVRQGDSILIEFPGGSWGVVDCKQEGPGEPSALRFLRSKGVRDLAFVCLTHPHADHFSGLPSILDSYAGRIGEFWCFGLDSLHHRKFLTVKSNAATTGHKRREFEQLCSIFQYMYQRLQGGNVRFLQANGRLPNFGGVDVDCIAPHAREVGRYKSSLACWLDHPDRYRADENQLSAVLRLRYGETTVVLGSDASTSSWRDVVVDAAKMRGSLDSELVKVSHHGSRQGYSEEAWEKMAKQDGTHAAISAGGSYGHPHRAVLTALRTKGVRIHCTNYAPSCVKTDRLDLSKFEGLAEDAKLPLLMLDQSSNAQQLPCDGDLHFEMDNAGTVRFAHQFAGFCPLHLPGSS